MRQHVAAMNVPRALAPRGASRPAPVVSSSQLTAVVRVVYPLALIAWLAFLLIPIDVGLADGGFVLSFTRRVLDGEIPHVDFISARPAGSAYVHIIDYLLPLPLLVADRLVAIVQVVAFSFCLGLLALDQRFRDIRIPGMCLLTAITLIDFHVFPAMGWHTIDGAFFSATGFLALERGLRAPERRWVVLSGCLLLGTAALMKQSFFAAPCLGFARIAVPALYKEGWRAFPRIVQAAIVLAIPSAAYVAMVAGAGGWHDMLNQVIGASPVYGEPLVDVLKAGAPGRDTLLDLMAIAAAAYAVVLWSGSSHWPPRIGEPLRRRLGLVARTLLTIVVLRVALAGRLQFTAPWQFQLFWMAVIVGLMNTVANRRLDWAALVIIALGWMVTLSYGEAHPAFIGGALGGLVVARAWKGADIALSAERLVLAATAGAVIAAGIVAHSFYDIRSSEVYLSPRSISLLTVRLGNIASSMAGIRTDPATAAYLAAESYCLREYPAKYTAIVPEDALSSEVFGLHNPLPADWLWPPEYAGKGARQMIVDDARRLGQTGEYLVLEPIIRQSSLPTDPPPAVPIANVSDPPPLFPWDERLTAQVFGPLKGKRVACGPFVGRYEPRRLK